MNEMSMLKALTEKQLVAKMKKFPDWHLNKKGTEISTTVASASFVDGLAYAARVAVHAEILGHHPDVELTYSKVKLTLTTHDAHGLTELDFALAKRIDELTK